MRAGHSLTMQQAALIPLLCVTAWDALSGTGQCLISLRLGVITPCICIGMVAAPLGAGCSQNPFVWYLPSPQPVGLVTPAGRRWLSQSPNRGGAIAAIHPGKMQALHRG